MPVKPVTTSKCWKLVFNQSDSHKWVSLIFDWVILVNAGIFLRSFWSRIYDSPNNIVSAFGSKKERKIHTNNRRNGCIILAIIADVLALRCTLDSTCMPRVCCFWVQRYEIFIFAFHSLNMQISEVQPLSTSSFVFLLPRFKKQINSIKMS